MLAARATVDVVETVAGAEEAALLATSEDELLPPAETRGATMTSSPSGTTGRARGESPRTLRSSLERERARALSRTLSAGGASSRRRADSATVGGRRPRALGSAAVLGVWALSTGLKTPTEQASAQAAEMAH